MDTEVNSKDYWDNRFNTDWIEKQGKNQSAFFAKIALAFLPLWLTAEIREKQLTICDWGCALGDGTNEINTIFPQNAVTGIDFSEAAVIKAKASYPEIKFVNDDILKNEYRGKFDVFFSSNTLEHFKNPWDILVQLCSYVNDYLVILIPYKEYKRHSEHFYSFDEGNIPSLLNHSFHLTYFKVINGNNFFPSYWGGLQALLIYSKKDKDILASKIKINSDNDIRIIEASEEQKEILHNIKEVKDSLLNNFNQLLPKVESNIEQYKKALEEKEEIIQNQKHLLEVRQLLDIRIRLETQLAGKELEINRLKNEKEHIYKQNTEKQLLIDTLQEELKSAQAQIDIKALLEKKLDGTELFIKELQRSLTVTHKKVDEKELLIGELNKKLDEINAKSSAEFNERLVLEDQLQLKELTLKNIQDDLDKANHLLEKTITEKEQLEEQLRKYQNKEKVQAGIQILTDEQLFEKDEQLKQLKKALEQQLTFQPNPIPVQKDTHQSIDALHARINRLHNDLEWYRSTFETRSLLGIMKDRAFKLVSKR